MVRTKILDQGNDLSVAEVIKEALGEAGFPAEEAIPGLVQAIILLAEETWDPTAAIDEATDLLSDGAVEAGF